MPPPPPLECSVQDCTFATPAGVPTWELTTQQLNLHTQAAHGGAGLPVAGGQATQYVAKLEKLPRPSFHLDMTEAEWKFKETQWSAYIGQSVVTENIKIQQLRAACDEPLLRRVFDAGGFGDYNTEPLLLERIKTLAVKFTHKTLHIQNMWSMKQDPEESIKAFCSRLVGTADLCDLTVTCSKDGCTQKTSFRDFLVMHCLLKGMADQDIRTRVLSRNQNNELETLSKVLDYISAEECSAQSFSSLPGSAVHNIAFHSAAARKSYGAGISTEPDHPALSQRVMGSTNGVMK